MRLRIKQFKIDKNHLPSSLIAHGIIYAVLVLLLASALLFIIPIQEKLNGEIVIHAYGYPVQVKTKQDGPIFLKIRDQEEVQAGSLVATQLWDIDTATYQSLLTLVKGQFDLTSQSGIETLDKAAKTLRGADLPEIQGYINKVFNAISQYKNQLRAIDPSIRIADLQYEIGKQEGALPLIDSLSQKRTEQVYIMRERFERDQSLVKEGALSEVDLSITEADLLEEEAQRLGNNLQRKTTEQNISALQSSINTIRTNYNRERAMLISLIQDAKNDLEEAFYQVAFNKFIKAPVSGVASKSPDIVSGMEMATDQILLTIVPERSSPRMEAYMYVGLKRAGEIRRGQKVYVRIEEYNPRDYGVVEATVLSISPVPNSNQYRLDLDLVFPLTTSFGYIIDQRPTYNGLGEIMTRRMSIFDKIMREVRWKRDRLAREPQSD